jgi:2-aminoadipate transaminase
MKNHGLSEMGRTTKAPPISWLMKLALSKPNLISLAAGFTDNASLPVRHAGNLLAELLSQPATGQAALQYGSTAGHEPLIQLTSERIASADRLAIAATRDGAFAASHYDPARMLITHGSQQLLYLATECLCDPGDIILIEDPTYFVYLGIVQSRGLRCRGIRMTDSGMDTQHLKQVLDEISRDGELSRVKCLYTVSYYQNPSSITTAFEKKKEMLDLLRTYERKAGHPIYAMEDAAYRELRFTGIDVPSMLAIPGSDKRVIYTGTYSKPFATGIRVGFGILPKPLFDAAFRLKGNHDFGTCNMIQHIMAKALASGACEDHLRSLHPRYARKARVMGDALKSHCPEWARWNEPRGGLYYWVRLPNRMKTGMKSKLFQAALKSEVLYVPGALCYADDASRKKPDCEIRLTFGNATESQIEEGVRRLGTALKS